AYIQLGLLYASVFDDLAIAYYNNALDLRPNSTEALYNKAFFLQEIEQIEEADSLYNKILEIDPEYYIAYYNKGFIRLVFSDNYNDAANLFTKAISFDETYYEAYYNRGYCFELLGEKEKALTDYKKALELKPDFTLAAKGVSRIKG